MKTPLDRLVAEAKAEDTKPRVTDASWDAMEARLMARVQTEQESFVREAPRSGRFARYAQLGVAALAVAAGTALVMKRHAPLESKPEAILPDLAVQLTEGAGDVRVAGQLVKPGQVLHAGDVVEAQGARVFLERPQKVTWLLDGAPPPASTGAARAQVKSMEDSLLVLSLEDGAVEAQVTPVPSGEAFAIDIPTEHALVRVAVHGTHLRVARAGSLVTVDLTEGVVAIGTPPATGLTTGTTVTAPSHVEFDAAALDATLKVDHLAVRSALPLKAAPVVVQNDAPPKAVAAPVTPRVAVKEKPRAAEPVNPQAPAPAVTGALPPREAIASAVRQCAASRPRDEKVRVSVSSSLRLKVGPSGDVQAAQFDPPLQPEIQTCAAAAIYKLKVTGAEDSSLTVPIDFTY